MSLDLSCQLSALSPRWTDLPRSLNARTGASCTGRADSWLLRA